MKINLGLVRTFLLRSIPLVNFLMILMVWADIPPRGWNAVLLILVVALAIILDYRVVFSQEQEVYFRHNPEWQKFTQRLDNHLRGNHRDYTETPRKIWDV